MLTALLSNNIFFFKSVSLFFMLFFPLVIKFWDAKEGVQRAKRIIHGDLRSDE